MGSTDSKGETNYLAEMVREAALFVIEPSLQTSLRSMALLEKQITQLVESSGTDLFGKKWSDTHTDLINKMIQSMDNKLAKNEVVEEDFGVTLIKSLAALANDTGK